VLLLLAIVVPFVTVGPWKALPPGGESFAGISYVLFNRYVFPFEVLAVLLLAALVGAILLAKREELP